VAEGGAGALQHLAQLRHRRQAVQLDVLVVLRGHSGGSGAAAVSALRWVGGGTEGRVRTVWMNTMFGLAPAVAPVVVAAAATLTMSTAGWQRIWQRLRVCSPTPTATPRPRSTLAS